MIAQLFSAISLAGAHPRDPAIAKMLGFGKANAAGVKVDEESVIALPPIKRALQIIGDKMFGMPWYVFQEMEEGRTWDREHRAWRCVYHMANPELSAPAFRQQLTQWAMTWGNGCAWIDRSGPHDQFYPLLPDRTKLYRLTDRDAEATGDEAGTLYYETIIGGERKLFRHDDVFHIRGMGGNPFWGYDIIELLSETFGGALAKEEFGNRFFSNGANPVGFITMEGSLGEEEEETYMDSLKKAMSGLGKAHKVILLEEGAKFQPVTIDPIKSQMLEGRQFDVRLLAMAIGIKVHKLIDGANSAFASLEQANHEHKDDDIVPWVNKFRIEYHNKLLSSEEQDSQTRSVDVDDESLDWVPFSERASGSVELYNNGLITKDEGRRKVNFGPSLARRAKDYRIPANIVYEDDQAMVAVEPELADDIDSGALSDVAEAYLAKIETRLTAQAKTKAKAGAKAFIEWLDALTPESGPVSIQTHINDLYHAIKVRLNSLAETTSEKELYDAI
jgi:HK97 family phage portal protein